LPKLLSIYEPGSSLAIHHGLHMTVASDAPQTDDKKTQQMQVMPFQAQDEGRVESLRHLFGPVAVVFVLCLAVAALVAWHRPEYFPKYPIKVTNKETLKSLLDLQLSDYKAGLVTFNTNISAQALVVATAVLVIIRRSDSLNFFGNSIPLSWLHVFIPVLLVYLFMAHGYISHRVISTRMMGLNVAEVLYKSGESPQPEEYKIYQNLFRDGSAFDAWFMSFIDTNPANGNLSGIDPTYMPPMSIIFVIVLAGLIGASHASALAMVCIGCRRYFATSQAARLILYYLLPVVPLSFLLVSHLLFAYAGPHRNFYQPWVPVFTMLLMGFFLWLSAKIDITRYAETLQCLRRQRAVTFVGPMERAPLRRDGPDRTIALIGDSLSTGFHVGSVPNMIVRLWSAWKTNWFLILPSQVRPGLVSRLSALGTITGIQHASVAAMVNVGRRQSVLNHVTGIYHFHHQVDEVLAGPFPDMLLIWIGHNDLDWRSQTEVLTPPIIEELSRSFSYQYESQLRRLINSALASEKRSAILVLGLANFASFFNARATAEGMRSVNKGLFPHLETGYESFVSMKPEYRDGMIKLATHLNKKLEVMCTRLGEQLSETKVRLVYSNTLSLTEMDGGTDLSSIDAWHPSMHGHSKLADSVYPIVFELAGVLGWIATSGVRGAG
jgi:lysophospholipase L1-like esterase